MTDSYNDTFYQAPEYVPPSMVITMGHLLGPRESVTFADLFGSDVEAENEYTKGLIGLGTFFLSWVVVWFLVLLALRCQRNTGCASGRAFQSFIEEEEEESDRIDTSSSSYDEANRADALFSTTKSINEEQEPYPSKFNEASSTLATINVYPDPVQAKYNNNDETSLGAWWSSTPERNRMRQKRTRIAYLVFSSISFICCCLLVRQTYQPIQNAVVNTGNVVTQGQLVVDQIDLVLQNITAAADGAKQVIDNDLTFEFMDLCPDIPPEELQDQLGVDPQEIARFLKDDFDMFAQFVKDNITAVEKVLVEVDRGLVNVQGGVDALEENIWWLPFVVISTLLLTMLFAAAVVLAWTEQLTPRMEKGLLWIGLPMFVVFTITCWTLVIATCFGTVVTSDICTAGPAPGSPDYTMKAILQESNVNPNSTTFELVAAYTGGCRGEDPVAEIEALQAILKENVDEMRFRLEQADAVGYDIMRDRCGTGNNVDRFFVAVRILEGQLYSVQVSLANAGDTLHCPKIHKLYSSVMQDSVCTDMASANANGFVLVLLVAISNMILISLRASWRRPSNANDDNAVVDPKSTMRSDDDDDDACARIHPATSTLEHDNARQVIPHAFSPVLYDEAENAAHA